MPRRDYGDVPVGEMDYESHEVPDDTSIEAYRGESLEEIIENHRPNPPAETLDCEWVARDGLYPNDWNPNFMPDHRKDLLVLSILDNGWTAPILVDEDDVIVDGEHRWRVAETPFIQDWDEHKPEGSNSLTPDGVPEGHVPVHRVAVDRKQAMLATYQQNYATGEDDARKLGDLVDSLDEEDQQFAATRMGVTDHELEMLLPDADISGDTTELWDIPWEDGESDGEGSAAGGTSGIVGSDTTKETYTERLLFDMTLEEAQLVEHIFGKDGMARGLLKLCRFVIETDLHEDVEDVPEPAPEGGVVDE